MADNMMTDKDYMERAIKLAAMGIGWTNPNPMVGAVIVKDGRIIGEGYHHRCGQLHAERDAFEGCKEDAKGATIYVTLEPCCHHGKQPPCTEAIVEHGIARVVIGSRDPNQLVSGKGVEFLRQHGIEVVTDFMRQECDKLNPVFFHYITTRKPYVVMKYAMTLDGKIATRTGASKWITSQVARDHVHMLRKKYSAILAGIGTVLSDDPMLNCRNDKIEDPDGKLLTVEPHQPLRVVVDSKLHIPEDSAIVKTSKEYKTVVACAYEEDQVTDEVKDKIIRLHDAGIEVLFMNHDGKVDLVKLMEWLGEHGYDSLLIEGGGSIGEAALKAGIVNHLMAYVAPKIFGGCQAKSPVEGRGVELVDQAAEFKLVDKKILGEDILLEYDLVKGMNDVYWNS